MSDPQEFFSNGGLVSQAISNEECGICKDELDHPVRIACRTPLCRPPVCCRACTTTFLEHSASCLYCREPLVRGPATIGDVWDRDLVNFPFGDFGEEAVNYYAGTYTDAPDDCRDEIAAHVNDFRDCVGAIVPSVPGGPHVTARLDPELPMHLLFESANAHLASLDSESQVREDVVAFKILFPSILDVLVDLAINGVAGGSRIWTRDELWKKLLEGVFHWSRMHFAGEQTFGLLIA